MEITVTLVRQIRDDIENALSEIGKKYGVGFSLEKIRYDNKSFSGRFNCLVLSEEVKSIEEQEFIQFVESEQNIYNLKKKHYKSHFEWNGKDFQLIGIRLSNRKYPVIAKRVKDGTSYKLLLRSLEEVVQKEEIIQI